MGIFRPKSPDKALSGVLESSPIPEMLIDKGKNVITLNNAMERLSGHTQKFHIGKRIRIVPEDFDEACCYMTRLVFTRGGIIDGRIIPFLKLDGTIEEVFYYAGPVYLSGKITYMRSLFIPAVSIKIPSFGSATTVWPHDKNIMKEAISHMATASIVETNAKIIHEIWQTLLKASIKKD